MERLAAPDAEVYDLKGTLLGLLIDNGILLFGDLGAP